MSISQPERDIFTDLYAFYVKHNDVPLDKHNSEYFSTLADEATQLVTKHNNAALAVDLFLAVYDHFGKRRQRMEDYSVQQNQTTLVSTGADVNIQGRV